jgi:transcriptional regulator with XRE-family HTH domain
MAVMVRAAIAADGLTQAEFARRVGVTEKHVSRFMTGASFVSMETLDYWAFVLGRHWTIDLVRNDE